MIDVNIIDCYNNLPIKLEKFVNIVSLNIKVWIRTIRTDPYFCLFISIHIVKEAIQFSSTRDVKEELCRMKN